MYKIFYSIFFVVASFSLFADEEKDWELFKRDITKYIHQMDGWCPDEKAHRMMDLTKEHRPAVFVEIGVFGGRSFLPVTATMKYLEEGHAYGVDPWSIPPALEGNEKIHRDWWSQLNFDAIYRKYMRFMSGKRLNQYFTNLHMTSKEALEYFEDESIDILHIDGNHAEESALFDAIHWLKKVRDGGYIWFDDVNWSSTEKAVAYLCQYCIIDPSSTLTDDYVLFQKREGLRCE